MVVTIGILSSCAHGITIRHMVVSIANAHGCKPYTLQLLLVRLNLIFGFPEKGNFVLTWK